MTDEGEETVPVGYRWLIVMATCFKRTLAHDPMTAQERLELLEALHAMTDQFFVPDALAILAPADDVSLEIVQETLKLDGGRGEASFDVLTSRDVFGALVRANPTIAIAIQMCARRPRPPAPEPPPQQPAPSTVASVPYRDPRLERAAEPQIAQGVEFDLF